MHIAFCISFYDKPTDVNLLIEILRVQERRLQHIKIGIFCCCTHEYPGEMSSKVTGYDEMVPYQFPAIDKNEDMSNLVTKKVFQCIRLSVGAAFEKGWDKAVFLHADLYPLDLVALLGVFQEMDKKEAVVGLRGWHSKWGAFWMDDNIILFDHKFYEQKDEAFDVSKYHQLAKPFFRHGIHHVLPIWLKVFLDSRDIHVFSWFKGNLGIDRTQVNVSITPLNYDPILKILHANAYTSWNEKRESLAVHVEKLHWLTLNGFAPEDGIFLQELWKNKVSKWIGVKIYLKRYLMRFFRIFWTYGDKQQLPIQQL